MNSRFNIVVDIKIKLLGDFELLIDGSPVKVSAQKSKALLAWLACHRAQPQSRDRLVGLLWADRSEANAKASLRQAAAGLRKLAETLIVGDNRTLGLGPSVTCDVDEFRKCESAKEASDLKEILSSYQGHLLEGFALQSGPFEEWLLVERESLRRIALAGFERLLEHERAAGDLTAAIAVAGRLLTLDPLQEHIHRILMQLYVDQGQLGSARRQFQQLKQLLDKELGVAPAPETVALLQSIGQGSPATPTAATKNQPIRNRRASLPGILVLPFANKSSHSDNDYLADGMTEELINMLGGSNNWRVSARNLSFHYRDQSVDVRKLGEDLGVAYVVEGSIRSAGQRLRISAALTSTEDGSQIWAEKYDRDMADIFDIQDEVVHAIFRTLKNRLGFAERERIRRTPTTNLDAWGLLMKAMQVTVVDPKTLEHQLALVREALEIDPEYPRAHAYLASLLFTSVGRGTSPNPKEYAGLAAKHTERALGNGPTDAVVLRMCAGGLMAVGQRAHALALAEQAYELTGAPDPLLVAVLLWSDRLDEAKQYCDQIIDALPPGVPTAPGELRPISLLGNIYLLKDQLESALACALKDQRSNPGNFFSHVNVANIYGLLGQQEEAEAAWQLAKTVAPKLTVKQFAKGYRSVFLVPEQAAKLSAGLVAAGLGEAS